MVVDFPSRVNTILLISELGDLSISFHGALLFIVFRRRYTRKPTLRPSTHPQLTQRLYNNMIILSLSHYCRICLNEIFLCDFHSYIYI